MSASMRPRFANRGSPAALAAILWDLWSFNEAPIRESGKLIRARGWYLPPYGFNEAPIRESGKFVRAERRCAGIVVLQ